MTEDIVVQLVTRPDVPNRNGVIFTRAACEQATRLLNAKDHLVTNGYPRSAPVGSVPREQVCGVAKSGTAMMEGDVITVTLRISDPAVATLLRTGRLSVGGAYTSGIDDQGRVELPSFSLTHLAVFPLEERA